MPPDSSQFGTTFVSMIDEQSAYGQWSLAQEYVRAAHALMESGTSFMAAPVYHLIAHAAELALKSWLLATGTFASQLRSPGVRHNLVRLVAMSVEAGLQLSLEQTLLIEALSPAHRLFRMRYGYVRDADEPRVTEYRVPDQDDLLGAIETVIGLTAVRLPELAPRRSI